jgi:AcrR family transcriptional regulator
MPKSARRKYRSKRREQQAEETRARILGAARTLIQKKGFAETTIDAIAVEAGVAPPTVYATFQSKRGILQALMERAAFNSGYTDLIREAGKDENPDTRLRFAARISRQIYDALQNEAELLHSAASVAPDFVRDKEKMRYERQSGMVRFLEMKGALRKDLSAAAARDILWALTSRDVYRLLVMERKWSAEEFEKWLGDMLVSALIRPEKK